MQEGTFPNVPGGELPKPQNTWETSQNILPQGVSETYPGQFSSNPPSVVFKTNTENGSQGNSKFNSKKLIKLVLGIFILLTLALSFFTFILPLFSKKEPEEVIINYWGLFENENVMKPVIAQFEEENPYIKVNYRQQELNEYTERLLVRANNGKGPDVFRYHNTWYPTVSSILLPLPKETIEKSDFNNNYYDFTKNDLIKRGVIYGIPLQTDTLSLFINTELFKQASVEGGEVPIPKTWQEFIDSSQRLTKRDESGAISIAGAGIGTYNNIDYAPDILSLLFAQNGVDLYSPNANQDKMADAIRFYTNFATVEGNVWDSTQDTAKLAFSQGKLAMYFGYSKDLADFKNQNSNLQIKVVPVPQLITDEKINIASYWVEGVSNKSEHPKESLLFLNYLARKDVQEKIYEEKVKVSKIGSPYSLKNLAEKLKDTDLFTFVDQSSTAVSTPFVSGTMNKSYNEKINEYIGQAINSVLSGGSESDAAQVILNGYSEVKSGSSTVRE